MPYKLKHSVRKESKEIVELLLNAKKRKEDDSNEDVVGASESGSYSSDDNLNKIEFSSSDDNAEFIDSADIKSEIAAWAIKHTITTSATNDLLNILRKFFPFLPKDARTLKQTPRDAPIVAIQGGNYVHYGLKDCLTDFLSCTKKYLKTSIDLNINIDGLPVAKSSLAQAWPVLINVNDTDFVHTVGIYSGNSKPIDVNEFLGPFIKELTELMKDNFSFDNKTYKVNCRAFICDAPARSLVLGIKTHTGYSCCHKCNQKGDHINNRMVFKYEENTLRTDENFRKRLDKNHHKIHNHMAIEDLPIDLITSFPMDYMHVVCLGVVKTLMTSWIKKRNTTSSLSRDKITILNNLLLCLKGQLPREFRRSTRDLNEFDRYKATELRTFLLYVGPFILKGILDDERYFHFLQLSLAIRILLSPEQCRSKNKCADALLKNFLKYLPKFYDESISTYNFHCLTHLASDCLQYGSCETFSAFKFENKLGMLKRLLKKKIIYRLNYIID